jgi:aspartate aminotransferase
VSQVAAAAALDGDQSCVGEMVAAYKARSDYLVEALNGIPGFECREGEGAFYAFPRVTGAMQAKGISDDAEFAKLLLNKAEIVVVPGTPFGAPGYVRLSFACAIEELEKSVARIRSALV